MVLVGGFSLVCLVFDDCSVWWLTVPVWFVGSVLWFIARRACACACFPMFWCFLARFWVCWLASWWLQVPGGLCLDFWWCF